MDSGHMIDPGKWRRMTEVATMTHRERDWLQVMTEDVAEQFETPTVVHIGVHIGVSLICAQRGAPCARFVGVDIDTGHFEGDGVQLIEGDSGEVWRDFHEPVHFLFIDGDHSKRGVMADLHGWAGKVRPGGILAFHDHNSDLEHFPHTTGVREAVAEWTWLDTTWEEIPGADSIVALRRKPFLQRGDGWGSIGIGVPYYKPVYDFFQWWSWLLVGGLEAGDLLLNGNDVPGEMPIPLLHNALVREFLRSDRDTLCVVEDDHVGPQDVIRKMRLKPENRDFDIVCASYTNRRGPMTAVGVELGDTNQYGEYNCVIRPMGVWRNGTQPVDCAALGLVLIRRWVLDAMLEQADWNPDECFWFDWRGRNSQDVRFYARARDVGARTGIDRDNDIGHIGQKVYTMSEYYQFMDWAEKEEATAKQEVLANG